MLSIGYRALYHRHVGSERAPLFVRLSTPLLAELDDHIRAAGRTKQAVVEELLASQLRVSVRPDDEEILDLAAVAAMLRVDEAEVLDRIAAGDFPARRFGGEWRASRSAVIAWLHGTDPVADRHPGFASR